MSIARSRYAILPVAAAIFALTGTGAPTLAQTAQPTAQPTAAATSVTNASATAAATSVQLPISGTLPSQITVTYMQSGTYDKAAQAIAPAFLSKTGVKVKVVSFPWAVLRQNNTNDLLTGAGQYDAMSGGYYLADVYDKFAPLDDYITKSNYANGMIPGLLDVGKSEYYQGHHIGIPYGIDSYGLMANNDILKAAGVTPDFKTWDDFLAACKTIVASQPGISCFSHSTGNPEQIGAFFFSGYDSYYVSKDGKYQLDAAKATAVASTIVDLWKYLPPNGNALSYDEAEGLFADGKVAFLIDWPSFSAQRLDDPAKSKVAGHWSQVKFPGNGFPWLSLWQQFIPADTQNKDVAWAWISTFAGPDQAKSNFINYGINSVWLSVYNDPVLAAQHAHQWPAMLDSFQRAKNPPLSGESQDFLTNTLVQIATGQISAADGIKQVNDKWATLSVPPSLLDAAKGSGLEQQ